MNYLEVNRRLYAIKKSNSFGDQIIEVYRLYDDRLEYVAEFPEGSWIDFSIDSIYENVILSKNNVGYSN